MRLSRRRSVLEQVMKLNDVVRAQADIIDAMFILLLQHVPTEDAGFTKITEAIESVAEQKETLRCHYGE